MSDDTKTICDLTELLSLLQCIDPTYDGRCQDQPVVWYRGQTSDHPPHPIPKILRAECKPWRDGGEARFNHRFLQWAASFLENEVDVCKTYFMAQHYGLPTRLLDWTSNPLVALFFAVTEAWDEKHKNDNGVLYVLHPARLLRENFRCSLREDEVGDKITPLFCEQKHCEVKKTEPLASEKNILPITPIWRFKRMIQQSSYFSLHLPEANWDEALACEDKQHVLDVYTVPQKSKDKILDQLFSVGITWFYLFPDLEHVAKQVQTSFCGCHRSPNELPGK